MLQLLYSNPTYHRQKNFRRKMMSKEKDKIKKLVGEEEHPPGKLPGKPERRLYFPTYGGTFPLWMRNKVICEEFLRLFARGGKPVKLLGKPKKEQAINLGDDIRGVRFDIVAEAEDFHIYCLEAQREFMPESRTDRTVYYGCTGATRSRRFTVALSA